MDCLDGGTVAGAGSHLMSTLLCYYVDIVICLPSLAGNNHIVLSITLTAHFSRHEQKCFLMLYLVVFCDFFSCWISVGYNMGLMWGQLGLYQDL